MSDLVYLLQVLVLLHLDRLGVLVIDPLQVIVMSMDQLITLLFQSLYLVEVVILLLSEILQVPQLLIEVSDPLIEREVRIVCLSLYAYTQYTTDLKCNYLPAISSFF